MKRHKSAFLAVLFMMPVLGFAQERGSSRGGAITQQQAVEIRNSGAQEAVRWFRRDESIQAAWWTNTALLQRIGLTEDQKTKIERAYENHRVKIMSTTDQLEKEEAQLARLLDAESIDQNSVLTQIDRVIQARGEMERASSAMTLEMRGHLTRAQWAQLRRNNWASTVRWYGPGEPSIQRLAPAPTPGARRGGRGQQ